MNKDRVALHGFGKMFEKMWHDQLKHVSSLTNYIVKRGGLVKIPQIQVNLT